MTDGSEGTEGIEGFRGLEVSPLGTRVWLSENLQVGARIHILLESCNSW